MQVGIVNLRIQLLQSPAAASQMAQRQQAAGVTGAAPIAGAAPLAGVPVAGSGMPVAGGVPVAAGSGGGGGGMGMGTGAALGAGALGGAALGAGAYAASSHAGGAGGSSVPGGGMVGAQQPAGVVPVAVIPPGGMGAGGVGGGGGVAGAPVSGLPAGSGLASTMPMDVMVDSAVVDFNALQRIYGYSLPTGGIAGALGSVTGNSFNPYVIARINDSALAQQQTRTVSYTGTAGAGGAIMFNDTLRFPSVRGTDIVTFYLADDNTFWKDR